MADAQESRPDGGVERTTPSGQSALSDRGLENGPPAGVSETGHPVEKALDAYRTPIEVLTERAIGTTSRPLRFDWRNTTLGIAASVGQLVELNNFWSGGVGGFIRTPVSGLMLELGFNRVQVWSTESSEEIADTPYRQYGRPSRYEIDLNLGLPVAEGVVTAWPRYLPAAELVFSFTAGFRYLLYPNAFSGANFGNVIGAIFSPTLSTLEEQNLLQHTPPGMQVDPGRYGLMAGVTTDIYFQSGIFITPRVMVAVPLLAPVTQTHLLFWWELTLAAGWAF
jgi:hypothetical protein